MLPVLLLSSFHCNAAPQSGTLQVPSASPGLFGVRYHCHTLPLVSSPPEMQPEVTPAQWLPSEPWFLTISWPKEELCWLQVPHEVHPTPSDRSGDISAGERAAAETLSHSAGSSPHLGFRHPCFPAAVVCKPSPCHQLCAQCQGTAEMVPAGDCLLQSPPPKPRFNGFAANSVAACPPPVPA